MQLKVMVLIALVFSVLGAGVAWYFKPAEIKTVTVEKIVKDVQIKTVTRERVKPNGEIEREIVSDSVSHFEKNSKVAKKPDWYVALSSNRQLDEFGLSINRRLLGDFFLSAEATTRGRYGLGIGVEF